MPVPWAILTPYGAIPEVPHAKAETMPSSATPLAGLTKGVIHRVRGACVILLLDEHRRYYDGGPLLPVSLSRLRDDAGELLGMKPLGKPPAVDPRELGQMTDAEMGNIASAVSVLLSDGCRPAVEDPTMSALLNDLADALRSEKAERAVVRAAMRPG
jgi:hypothetical protein